MDTCYISFNETQYDIIGVNALWQDQELLILKFPMLQSN